MLLAIGESILCLYFIVYFQKKVRWGISLLSFFLLNFLFYQIFPAFFFIHNLGPYFLPGLELNTIRKILLFNLLPLVSLLLGSGLFKLTKTFFYFPRVKYPSVFSEKNFSFLLFLAALIFIFIYEVGFRNNLISSFFVSSIISSFLFIIMSEKTNSFGWNVYKSLLFIIVIFALIISGNRRYFVGILIFLYQLYLYRKATKPNFLFITILIFLTLVGVIGLVIIRTMPENLNTGYSIEKTIEFLNRFQNLGLKVISGAIDSPICFFFYGKIVEYVPNFIPFINGYSFIRMFFYVIPRSIWPEKPIPLSLKITATFFPFWGDRGVSSGATLVGELYWNFGHIGLMIFFFFIGYFFSFLERSFKYHAKFPIFTILLMVWIPDLLRGGGFSNSLLGVFIIFYMPFVLYFFANEFFSNFALQVKK